WGKSDGMLPPLHRRNRRGPRGAGEETPRAIDIDNVTNRMSSAVMLAGVLPSVVDPVAILGGNRPPSRSEELHSRSAPADSTREKAAPLIGSGLSAAHSVYASRGDIPFLPLRELRCLTRLLEAVLLAFFHSRITREETGALHHRSDFRIRLHQRAGNPVA